MRRRLVTAVLSTAVATAGLSLVTAVPASAATQLVKDGGFEAAAFGGVQIGGDSPDWVEADSIYGSPLCNDNRCGTGGGASAPGPATSGRGSVGTNRPTTPPS